MPRHCDAIFTSSLTSASSILSCLNDHAEKTFPKSRVRIIVPSTYSSIPWPKLQVGTPLQLLSNFRDEFSSQHLISSSQIFSILEETSLPDLDVISTPNS